MNCASNIITANFSGGKTHATTARVYQWSRGIELCITGADDLPQTFKAHFSVQKRGGVATTIVGIDERVDVPNVLFTIGKDIHVWLGASETEDDAEILYTVDIPVAPAPMPEYYDAEDTGVFDAVVEQVADYAATATAAANSAGASATAAAGSASAAAASASSAAGSAAAAEQARADAVTAKGQAETAAQTATEKAQQTAQNASQAALDAGRAESAAERAESAETGAWAAKTAAEAAAQNAAASAATANEKATLAGQSATAAAGSASAAAQSAASIEGDVQIASQKASEAQTAAGQAVTAKEAAQTARQGAETAATNAGQSASTATAKAAEAATSASNAAQSKTDAEAAAARAEQAAATLTVDTALSDSSTNPVQNKVITGEITDVKTALSEKYDRYSNTVVSGLSLDMLDVCPSQYSMMTYEGTDAYKHSTLSGTGITNLIARMKKQYSDITFRTYYVTNALKISIASNGTSALAFTFNVASGNTFLFTATTSTYKSGILLNSNCRSIVRGDKLNFKIDGTKVALYLIDNDVPVPVWADEWIDVIAAYPNEGFTADDVTFGLVTTNSSRNDPLIYDFSYGCETGDHFMYYDEVDGRLSALENGAGFNPSRVDLFMFMGQSNMAGRGTASQAPGVIAEAGYEFRAISDPTKLYPITEPFGLDENVEGKIYDYLGGYKAKSGDMVPAFVNAYFEHTHVSIVGVSASEGGTRISLWQPGTARYTDALARFTAAVTWLEQNGYTIRHKYMLWCQGESNGDDGMSKADYISAFTTMANAWFTNGIEKIFLIKIGNYNGTGSQDYNTIMDAQNEICQTMDNVVMASTDFAGMKDRGLMKDDFHYQQAAYNEVGTYAGINTALYVNTGKEPTMYDTQDGSLYFSHKN